MAIAAASSGVVAASTTWAQPFPQRPVKIAVAGLPGTSFDLIARAIADKLSASLKQTFIVENRPGAAGKSGAEAVARNLLPTVTRSSWRWPRRSQ